MVRRRPRVAILATGDELLEVDEPLVPGKIRNSNEYTNAALVDSFKHSLPVDTLRRDFKPAGKPFNLAVSLHAANDRLRNELVPVNERIGIGAVLEAAGGDGHGRARHQGRLCADHH